MRRAPSIVGLGTVTLGLLSLVVAMPAASAATAAGPQTVSGSFSGTGTLSGSCTVQQLPVSGSAQGTIAPFGASTLTYSFCQTAPPPIDPVPVDPGGTLTLTNAGGSVTGTISGTVEGTPNAAFRFPYHFEIAITAGTGTLAGTTGTLILDGTFGAAASTIDGTASGTVTLPAATCGGTRPCGCHGSGSDGHGHDQRPPSRGWGHGRPDPHGWSGHGPSGH